MADKYEKFASLERGEGQQAFSITLRDLGTPLVIAAPHGGSIEPGTSEIARAIAGTDFSLYLFEGRKADNNEDLHITSTNFDEPQCLALLGASKVVITVHGEGSNGEVIYLGGRATSLRARIDQALNSKGFVARAHDDPNLQGMHPRNICNIGRDGAGVQLEVSRGLRKSFFASLTRAGRAKPTERLNAFSEAVREALETKNTQATDLTVDAKALSEAIVEFQKTMAQVGAVIAERMSEFHAGMRNVAQAILPIAHSMASVTRDVIREIGPRLSEFAKFVEGLPAVTRSAFGTLAGYGWYPDMHMDMATLTRLIEVFRAGDATRVDQELIAHFNGRAKQIEEELCTAYPARAMILSSAFEAHRTRQYALSVPVMLMQADGICQELLGVQLYGRGGGKPTKVADALASRQLDDMSSAFLHPLCDVFPLIFLPAQRAAIPTALNRHAVIHGEAVDYDTELNSCKALSLIYFTHCALGDLP